jgi:hypothetical protein
MWYCAHVIMYFKFKDGQQDRFPVYENILLVEAATAEDAFEKAAELGRSEEGDHHGSLRWGGRPATVVYAGTRKVIAVRGPAPSTDDRPIHGAEVTYSQLVVEDAEALARLVEGEPVTVLYEE